MRAAAFNPVSARLVGIRVGWMLAFGWGWRRRSAPSPE
jgi:branched-chain amino acid transport system permease protein